MKRETREGLEAFRKQQEEADKRALKRDAGDDAPTDEAAVEEKQWIAGGRKRKRVKDTGVLKGVKLRKSSSTSEVPVPAEAKHPIQKDETTHGAVTAGAVDESGQPDKGTNPSSRSVVRVKVKRDTEEPMTEESATSSKPSGGLGLVDYGSDDE